MNRTCERALNAQYARLKARRVAASAVCQSEAPEWGFGASSRVSLGHSADPLVSFYEYLNRSDGQPVPEDNSDENVARAR